MSLKVTVQRGELGAAGERLPAANWIGAILILSVLLAAAGCDRSPTDSDGHGSASELELVDRATGDLLAYVHGDHWDGSIQLEPGQEIAVNARFYDADENEIPLGDEHTVVTEIVGGPAEGVVELSDHGDHVDIVAVGVGEVQVEFNLWHGAHSDWESPPLYILVVEAAGDPSDVARVELVDRETGEGLAHTDGTGEAIHWDGELPHLGSGEALEVDVVFRDSQDRPIALGGDNVVQARLTDGSPDGVVAIESHGDHVDIEALGEGVVELLFTLEHDGDPEFESPSIELVVEDP